MTATMPNEVLSLASQAGDADAYPVVSTGIPSFLAHHATTTQRDKLVWKGEESIFLGQQPRCLFDFSIVKP